MILPCTPYFLYSNENSELPLKSCCGCVGILGNATLDISYNYEYNSSQLLFSLIVFMTVIICVITALLLHSKVPLPHKRGYLRHFAGDGNEVFVTVRLPERSSSRHLTTRRRVPRIIVVAWLNCGFPDHENESSPISSASLTMVWG